MSSTRNEYLNLSHDKSLFVHGEEIIEAIKAKPWLARLLGTKSGAPIFYTQPIISDERNQVFECTERFARADKISFRASLEGDHTKIAFNDEMKVRKPSIKPPVSR